MKDEEAVSIVVSREVANLVAFTVIRNISDIAKTITAIKGDGFNNSLGQYRDDHRKLLAFLNAAENALSADPDLGIEWVRRSKEKQSPPLIPWRDAAKETPKPNEMVLCRFRDGTQFQSYIQKRQDGITCAWASLDVTNWVYFHEIPGPEVGK